MKKILSILVLSFGFMAVKAQTPKIHIKYDENGNRILRYYTAYRPAPPSQGGITNDVLVNEANEETAIDKGVMAALAEGNLKVYPNPSHDNFNIAVSEGILNKNAELLLIDQLGRVHQRKKIHSLTTTISTKGMADGTYSIIVQHGDTKSTTKVVKVTN